MNLVYKFSLNRFTMKCKKKKRIELFLQSHLFFQEKTICILLFFIFLAMMIRAFTSRIFSSI